MSGHGGGDGPGVDLWILSFSDCMVNLMAFFVMMLTFSGSSHEKGGKGSGVEGVVQTPGGNSVMAMPGAKGGGSMAGGVDHLQESTTSGSESATDSDPVPTRNPKESPGAMVGAEAMRARHDVAIPCRRIFYGEGSVLRSDSRECLSLLAGYLGKVPNAVAVSAGVSEADVERASVIIEYLTNEKGLKVERFSIGVTPTGQSPGGGAMLVVSVLPRSVCP